jgi:glycosyltransferase involved in cell wall biosynthesis
MEHLVTIIIPTFNRARYIKQSVGSALSQSYLNLEVIVVDDGSTDDTMAILAGFADERLHVVTQKNSGPSAAINHGLRLARGEFLALLGADDVAELPRIESQVAIMTTTQNAAVFCKPTIIDAEGNLRLDSDQVRVFDSLPKGNAAADHIRTLFYHGNYLCAPSACLRRSTVERVGLFHEGLVQLQDMEYWIRMFGLGMTCAVQENKFVRYRRHGENLSSTARKFAADREHCFVLQHFFEHVQPRVARAAFAKVLDPDRADLPLCPDERAMVYLSHPNENVRELAYADLIAFRQHAAIPTERHLLDFVEYFDVLNENLR